MSRNLNADGSGRTVLRKGSPGGKQLPASMRYEAYLPLIPYGQRPAVLLVGNGINRCFEQASWSELILSVRTDAEIDPEELKKLPLNMQIIAATGNAVDESMKKISEMLADISISPDHGELLKKLVWLPADTILTTNYSYELERGLMGGEVPARRFRGRTFAVRHREQSSQWLSRYSMIDARIPDSLPGERRAKGAGRTAAAKAREGGAPTVTKQIWHIHGEINLPYEMVMGHYYYGKLLGMVTQYLPKFKKRYEESAAAKKAYRPRSWVDYFLLGDIYMIGFGMNESEMDLWYLLGCKHRHYPESKVYFHMPEEDLKDAKRFMLRAYGVTIITGPSWDGYYAYYMRTADEIRERMTANIRSQRGKAAGEKLLSHARDVKGGLQQGRTRAAEKKTPGGEKTPADDKTPGEKEDGENGRLSL